jgi:hypothetical protein
VSFFQAIALPLAERGFQCFPLIPKSKRPISIKGAADHFDASTTDPEQIKLWDSQEPNANVGMAPDEIFCFLETDDEAALHEACSDISPEVWHTTRVSARSNRCYYIFRQTARTRLRLCGLGVHDFRKSSTRGESDPGADSTIFSPFVRYHLCLRQKSRFRIIFICVKF